MDSKKKQLDCFFPISLAITNETEETKRSKIETGTEESLLFFYYYLLNELMIDDDKKRRQQEEEG